MTPFLSVQHLSYGYSARAEVVRDISFDLALGLTVLLGANGAGKSTLMQLIAGELRPPTGTIFVGGEDVRRSDSWRQRIGWVPQRSVFDPAQRAVDFVADVGWLRGMDRATARHHAVNALRIMGLEEHSTTRLRAISGGMQRRAMVAAGIVHEPDVLLLDEPTAGLDPHHRSSLIRALRDMASNGTSVLMSTHIAADMDSADRALILHRGCIAADSSVADFIERYGSVEQGFCTVTEQATDGTQGGAAV